MNPQNSTPPDNSDEDEAVPEKNATELQSPSAPPISSPPDWRHEESVASATEPVSHQVANLDNFSAAAKNAPVTGAMQPVMVAPAPQSGQVEQGNQNAGLIVLQWLTYAFWGWALLALSSLTASILANYIAKAETGTFTPYAIAAVLVLLPAAFACEHFYSKKEPIKKTGAALAVMVIHAVIFALFAVGALITAVFMLVSFFVSSGDTEGKLVVLFSALIIFIYYLLTFIRTVNIQKFARINQLFRYIMLVTVGIIIVFGIVGPVARERSLRDDRLLEDKLGNLSRDINNYVSDNGRLPESLKDVDVDKETKQIVDRNMVEYKKVTTPASAQQNSNSRLSYVYYELCVTFKEESRYYESYSSRPNEYDTYLSAYNHPQGYHCYKVRTVVTTNNNPLDTRFNSLQ